ncbi:YceD family protein [Tessaracoccus flavus]|uniref:Metal-binding protein n=1 Tax=Tessaracoccus flavus TaxID=1610493 RepID=A0A1Q2CFJ0_9ACTN|nr:metal-binding protein [Tessaracoccus flavus]
MSPVHHQPDRRSPLVFEMHELARQAGTMKQVTTTVPAPADLGNEVIGVPQDSDIELDLRFEAVTEGVLVTGTATVQLRGQCARCLDDIEDEESFDVQELYFYPGREIEDDEAQIVEEMIDLDEALRDAVVLELPFTPLCEEDCLGLCPQCGFNRNDDPDHTHEQQIDPRWSKLSGLTGDTQD